MLRITFICILILTTFHLRLFAQVNPSPDMVFVGGGTFVPLYGSDSVPVKVEDFYLDAFPVTNAQFEAFVKENPVWKKSQVKRVFANESYLKHWSSDTLSEKEREMLDDRPVVNVSWFAAKAYCECQGKSLPSTTEWEYAALASETKANAARDKEFYQRILDWYSKPNPKVLPPVTDGFKNYYGAHGMIGLIWEWTSDFNSALLQGESRANEDLDRQLFCGAGSSGSSDVSNYVAYMRYAFRSSLKAKYSVSNLGFRCASGVPVN
ncbi:formylglycine-generating enzyme family protein [Cytophagaceae bacterium ABcell3]|nr:formylglycine-generating enzyme family protein [Cytophagaceae bacterium ABcell3]